METSFTLEKFKEHGNIWATRISTNEIFEMNLDSRPSLFKSMAAGLAPGPVATY
jgi:hypothetical protein